MAFSVIAMSEDGSKGSDVYEVEGEVARGTPLGAKKGMAYVRYLFNSCCYLRTIDVSDYWWYEQTSSGGNDPKNSPT